METCTDDNIFTISSFLLPRDLLTLALVCKRFGQKSNAKQTKRQQLQLGGSWPWSMMEEASRRNVSAAKDDKNNPWRKSHLLTIRGQESWVAVHQRLHSLQSSLAFNRIIGTAITYVSGDISHVQVRGKKEVVGFTVAICQRVMKAGVHYAEFTITNTGAIYLGIIRPINDWQKKKIKHADFFAYCRQQQEENDPGYEGNVPQYYWYDQTNSLVKGDVIGLQLCLTSGMMTVYKNGKCLGVKVTGLAGHYCWCVTMNKYGSNRPSVRIGYAQRKKESSNPKQTCTLPK